MVRTTAQKNHLQMIVGIQRVQRVQNEQARRPNGRECPIGVERYSRRVACAGFE